MHQEAADEQGRRSGGHAEEHRRARRERYAFRKKAACWS
jgi:hypothetical protein